MTKAWIIIVTLLPFTSAEVHIEFNLNENDTYYLTSSGSSTGDVDTAVRNLFSVTEERLRTGVEALAGSRPDRVFFDEPTGNVGTPFLDNGWKPTSAETILSSYDTPQIRRGRESVFVEHYVNPIFISFGFILPIQHRMSHLWGFTSFNKKMLNYRWVVDNRRPFMYSNNWGHTHRETMTSDTFVEIGPITLRPSNNLTYEVFRNSVTVDTTLLYSTHLSGNVVGFWSRGFNGSQFWAYDVQPVLRFGGMPLEAFTNEHISVYYDLGYEVRFRHTEEDDLSPPFE